MTAKEAKQKTCSYLNGAGNGGEQLQEILDAIKVQAGRGFFQMKYYFVSIPSKAVCKRLVEMGYTVYFHGDCITIIWSDSITQGWSMSWHEKEYNNTYGLQEN